MFWWDMHACLHKEVQSVPKQQTQKKHKLSGQWVQTRGILQRTMVYSFIYSTSYQTENSTLAANSKGQHCVFFHSRRCVLPERSWKACSLALSRSRYPLSTKQKLIPNQNLSVRYIHSGEREERKQVGRCGLNRKRPALSTGPGYGSRAALLDSEVGDTGIWGLASLQDETVNELKMRGLDQREDWESYHDSLPGQATELGE